MADNKRQRSPNYPSIGLPEALRKIQAVFDTEGTHPADADTLARAMGYSGKNGTSDRALSALKKYNLLISTGNNAYKLSDIAINILHPESPALKSSAIKKAALSPELFLEFYNEFGQTLPSENNLRNRLLRKNFNAKVLDEVVRSLFETWEIINTEVDSPQEQEIQSSSPQHPQPPISATRIPNHSIPQFPSSNSACETSSMQQEDVHTLIFRISKDSEAKITFDGTPTQEAIIKLIALLDLSKDTFPTQQELEKKLIEELVREL
ncbi:MAG TPA: hypothetical protein V6C52_00695 [Coleofasciculaceae cyanobacterium]|jgi:hypothetical protein